MRQFALMMFLLSSLCWAQESGDFQPASTNVWGAEYPRVDSAGRVQIRVKAPDATKVKLNFWSGPKVDMEKQADGFWTITTPPLVPGFHYYTLIIDGAEVSDPNTQAFLWWRQARECGGSSGAGLYLLFHSGCAPRAGARGLVQLEGDGNLAARAGLSAAELRYADQGALSGALSAAWRRRR